MPLFMIQRSFPGATDNDLDAAAVRAVACAPFHVGLRWIRSFWDAENEQLTCYYEANAAEDIRRHADRAQIPCDEVMMVEEILPERFTNV